MTAAKVFSQRKMKTHMPFATDATLLFCSAGRPIRQEFECGGTIWQRMKSNSRLKSHFKDLARKKVVVYRPWKLHFMSWSDQQPKRIETGLPASAVECSPAFYHANGTYFVSFIGGVPGRNAVGYHLYQMSGPTLDELQAATPVRSNPTFVGFLSEKYICYGRKGLIHLDDRAGGEQLRLRAPFARVLRVSFRTDEPEQLIMTGSSEEGEVVNLVYAVDTGETYEISSTESLYKPTLHDDQVVFAKKLSHDFEDRELWKAPFSLGPASLAVQVVAD